MDKTLKILGRRGRITIPYDIRKRLGFEKNDVLSFEDNGIDTVIIKREILCTHCADQAEESLDKPDDEVTLLDFLDNLSLTEQRAALIHLSLKWATQESRNENG